MTVSTIAADADLVTLVNVFTVDPDRRQELVAALERATTELFAGTPGFVSANLHVSLDGHRVINYAQWVDAEVYRATLERPDVLAHLEECAAIADSYDPTLTRVEAVFHA
jgi:quinol monooxygenase YgiN